MLKNPLIFLVDSCQPNSHGIWRFFLQRNNGRFLEVNAVFTVFLFCFFLFFFREEKKVSYWLLTMDWTCKNVSTGILCKNDRDRIPRHPGTSKLRSVLVRVLRLFRGGPWVRGLSRLEISWIVAFEDWMARCYPMGHFLHYLEQSPQTLVMSSHRGKVVCFNDVYLWNDWFLPSLSMLISVLVHNGVFVNLLFLIQRVHMII